ncbi:Tigger transposable element-derived protein 6 [Cucumispora dikerogammari]|nr:Tigger transposable element-derived protein 6 [Cucumispora dikerogammari]
MLCSNFTGTDKRAPFMIGKSVKPRCFRTFKISNTIKHSASKKAWLTSYLFNNWLLEFYDELNKDKKILLLIDNCPAHTITKNFKMIEILFFPKNVTNIIQPFVLGIIQNFKTMFLKYKLVFILQQVEAGVAYYEAYRKLDIVNVIIFTDLA